MSSETPALDGAGLLLELGIRPEVVRLARRRLADPARRTAAAEVLERSGQGADGHATRASRFGFMATTFALSGATGKGALLRLEPHGLADRERQRGGDRVGPARSGPARSSGQFALWIV